MDLTRPAFLDVYDEMATHAPDPTVRQWTATKVVVSELDRAFEHIADAEGRVEKLHHNGGRDWIIFWSKPVVR
jgi:hypothetical protein